jgi:hypothetical protein
MSFTSSLNYTQTLTQEASGSLTLLGSGSTGRTDVFTVNGNNGTLFSVSDDLSNSLFSVNTIAGLPVIEAFANNTVVMGQYGQNVLVITGSRVGIGTATPSQKLHIVGTGFASSDFRAPIFYDSDDTNYYLNPTSNTSIRTVGSWRADSSAWDGEFSGKMQYHANQWYIQGADNLIYRNANGVNVFSVNQLGSATATSDYRAPIFYDSDNTGYYGDFASTSNLNDLQIQGDIKMQGSDSYIWMPNNNSLSTGFYDPVSGLIPIRIDGPSDGIYIGNTMWISYNTNNTNDYNENIRLFPSSNGVSVIAFRASGTGGTPSNSLLGYSSYFEIRQGGQWQLRSYADYIEAYGSFRAPIFYDSNDTGYYLDPNSTSNLNQLTTNTRARWNMPRWWTDRTINSSDQNYWTGTNGWSTDLGTWANAWKGGFSGWDIWGNNTDHPQGSGYVHAQGIVSGQHYATTDGSQGYGWMMVGAASATDNRYWLRGKWGGTTSSWVEMITTGNIGSQNVSYASSAGNADTLDGYHETSFIRIAANSSSPTNANFAIGQSGGRNFIQSHAGQPLDINPLGNTVYINSNVGIGTSSPGGKLDINSATNSNALLIREDTDSSITHNLWIDSGDNGQFYMYANGQSNTIGLHTAGASFFNGGNVGIGTTSPISKLHVYDGYLIGGLTSTTGAPNPVGVTTQLAFEARSTSAGNDPSIAFHKEAIYTMYFQGQNSPRGLSVYSPPSEAAAGLFVQGDAGIGTTSPSHKLHVVGTGFASNDFRAPIFYDSQDTGYYADFNSTSRLNILALGTGNNGPGVMRVTAGHGDTSMRLTATGLGSGTIPTMQWWLSEPGITWNAGGFGYNVTNDGGGSYGFSRPNTALGQAYMRFFDSGNLQFYNADTSGTRVETMIMTSAGNIGIGTTNPGSYKLYVNGGQFGTLLKGGDLGTGSDVVRMLKANDSIAMLVRGDGNVGIGTTSPAVPLDVNGSTNIKGGITGQDSSNNYRYEFAPELAYTRVGVGGVGTYKINSGAVSTTSMLRIKSTSTSGWLSSQANYFNGTVISDGLCAEAISTVGTLLFLTTDGEWGIADADVAAKSVTLLGIALNSTSGIGETVDVLIDGIIALKSNHDQISIPASPGAPLYVSTNAGKVTEVAPAVSGDIVRLVGHNVWSATSPQNTAIIRFQPDNTWIEL